MYYIKKIDILKKYHKVIMKRNTFIRCILYWSSCETTVQSNCASEQVTSDTDNEGLPGANEIFIYR